MPLGSFANDSLLNLDAEDLKRMLELDESLFVEHKSSTGDKGAAHGLTSSIAAFANTLGGWLLLGVKAGRSVGHDQPWAGTSSTPTLADFVRDRLRGQIDPMPAFEARILEHDSGPVGVVRIFESADTPHVSVSTGAVYVREVAGQSDVRGPKKPGAGLRGEREYQSTQIRSRAQLLELSAKGRQADDRVRQLLDPLHPLPLIQRELPLSFEPVGTSGIQPQMQDNASIIVRLAPLTLPARFRGWATTADSAAALLDSVEKFSGIRGFGNDHVNPDPSGAAIRVSLEVGAIHADALGSGLSASASLVIDAAGVVGARLDLAAPSDEAQRAWLRLAEMASKFLKPTITAAEQILSSAEFLGRARIQADLVGIGGVFLLEEGRGTGTGKPWVPAGGDLGLPASEEDIQEFARRAANAYGRSAGLPAWD